MKLDPYLTPCTKINSKGIKNLSVKSKTIELLHKKAQGKYNTADGNDILEMTPKVQATITKIDKWYHNKLKTFCASRT